ELAFCLRAQQGQAQAAGQDLLYCSAQGLGHRRSGTGARLRRPNESFKPKPLRYAFLAAVKACHLARSTTRLGLTLVLGRMELEAQPYRFKVSLRLVHPSADLSHCSREFGLEPSRQWRAGDARTTPRGRPLEGVRGESYWTAPLDTSPHKNIADSLSHIASWLKEHSAFMANHARSGGSVELFIGFFLES